MSIGPAKCGVPNVTNPGHDTRDKRSRACYKGQVSATRRCFCSASGDYETPARESEPRHDNNASSSQVRRTVGKQDEKHKTPLPFRKKVSQNPMQRLELTLSSLQGFR